MNLKFYSVLSAILLAAGTLTVQADSLWCQGNIISSGITEEQLLKACGEPASRNGANWLYKTPGSIPMVVNLGNGVVMFIRDATELDSPDLPFGDPP